MLYFELRDILEKAGKSIEDRLLTHTKASWTDLGNTGGNEQMEKAFLLPNMNFAFPRKGVFVSNWRQGAGLQLRG